MPALDGPRPPSSRLSARPSARPSDAPSGGHSQRVDTSHARTVAPVRHVSLSQVWRGDALTVSATVGPGRRSCSGDDDCWMTMGWLSGALSAQMVWWSAPFLPFLDVVPSPAPGCLAPGLPHRHHIRERTRAAPLPRQLATRCLSRQPVRRMHPPARGGAAAGLQLWRRRDFGTHVGQRAGGLGRDTVGLCRGRGYCTLIN